MTRKPKNRRWGLYSPWLLVSLCAVLVATACKQKEEKPVDKVLRGVQDPEMQKRWKQADSEGKLPPIDAIPTSKQSVTRRSPVKIIEPSQQVRRPVIPEGTVAGAQPFSLKPVTRYEGVFQVTTQRPGVLVGTLEGGEGPLEVYYKIPTDHNTLIISEQAKLQLSLRDEVDGSALQRRILLHTEDGAAQFLYIAEGSDQPYRQTFEAAKIRIEQQETEGNPPVRVTYAGNSVTVKQGERKKIGKGERVVEVCLITSIASSQRQALLREGQRYYVNLILYRVP